MASEAKAAIRCRLYDILAKSWPFVTTHRSLHLRQFELPFSSTRERFDSEVIPAWFVGS